MIILINILTLVFFYHARSSFWIQKSSSTEKRVLISSPSHSAPILHSISPLRHGVQGVIVDTPAGLCPTLPWSETGNATDAFGSLAGRSSALSHQPRNHLPRAQKLRFVRRLWHRYHPRTNCQCSVHLL